MKKIVFLLFILFFLSSFNLTHAAPVAGYNADPDQVWFFNGTTYIDETLDAASTTAGDVTLPSAAGEELYVGMNYVFSSIYFEISTAGSGGAYDFQYWNGANWVSLTYTDNTNGFSQSGSVDFTIPSDWAQTSVNGVSMYYVRVVVTTAPTTAPLASRISTKEFNLKVAVQDELGNALTGLLSTDFAVANCDDPTIYDFREIGSGVYELALLTQGTDTNCDLTAQPSGYVSQTQATGALSTTLTDNTATPYSLLFGLKVVLADELGQSIDTTGLTITFRGNPPTQSDALTLTYYWADTAGANGVLSIQKDGYVAAETTNPGFSAANGITTSQAAQVVITLGNYATCNTAITTSTNCKGLEYSKKVTVTREADGAAITGATVTVGATNCFEYPASSGTYYCAATLADDDGTSDLTVVADGYVQTSVDSGDRTANTDPQDVVSVTNVQFAVRVNLVREVDNQPLTGATVTAGTSTNCIEPTTPDGSYYCAVPLADTNTNVQASLDGYVDTTGSFTDRTAHTDPQQVVSLVMPFTVRITVNPEVGSFTDLTGVSFERSTDGGTTYSAVTPDATSGNNAYFAESSALSAVRYRVSKTGFVTTAMTTDIDPVSTAQTQATITMPYTLRIEVNDELGNDLTSATITPSTTGGCALPSVTEGVNGLYYLDADPACFWDVTVSKNGYVDNSLSGIAVSSSAQTQQVVSLLFAVKLTSANLQDELGNALTPSSADTFNLYTDPSCTTLASYVSGPIFDAGTQAWYAAVAPGTYYAKYSKDGYVTVCSPALTTSSSSQANPDFTGANGLQFVFKVVGVTNELGNSIMPTSGAPFSSIGGAIIDQRFSGGAWYIAASSATTGLSIVVDGYVQQSVNVVPDSSQQKTIAFASSGADVLAKPLKYAVVVNVQREVDNANLAGATVKAGDGYTVVCEEPSVGNGSYYCAVPLAHVNNSVEVYLTGYVVGVGTYVDRVSHTDPQRVVSIVLQPTLRVEVRNAFDAPLDASQVTFYVDGVETTPTLTYNQYAYFALDPSLTPVITARHPSWRMQSTEELTLSKNSQLSVLIRLPRKVAGAAAPVYEKPVKEAFLLALVNPEKPVTVQIRNVQDLGVKHIEIRVKNMVRDVSINVELLKSLPSEIPSLEKKVHKYLSIEVANVEGALDEARVRFVVEKDWLTANNLQKENVALYRFNGVTWEKLDTKVVSETETSVEYEAVVQEFSVFAIAAEAVVEEQPVEQVPEQPQEQVPEQPIEQPQEQVPEEKPPAETVSPTRPPFETVSIVAILLLLAVLFAWKFFKR